MIHELNNNFFAISVPPESYWHQIIHISAGMEALQYCMKDGEKDVSMGLDLPPGEWEYICTSTNITEEQASEIVEQQRGGGKFKAYDMDGTSLVVFGVYLYTTALKSFLSLLRSKNLNGCVAVIKKK